MSQKQANIDAAKRVMDEYGYAGTVQFCPFPDMAIKWTRGGINGIYAELNFRISDYFTDAPTFIVAGCIEGIIKKIKGEGTGLPKEFHDYVGSEEFLKTNQSKYIRRKRIRDPQGIYKNLLDSVNRVMGLGLIRLEDIRGMKIGWMPRANYRSVGKCNRAFKVISISNIFDLDIVPNEVLDLVVYHELLHILQKEGTQGHPPSFKAKERLFPDYDKWDHELDVVTWVAKRGLIP